MDIQTAYTTLMTHITGLSQNPAQPALLIAASKDQTAASIARAYAAGVRHFGENKFQQAEKQWSQRAQDHPDVTLHFIGQIQSKKLASVARLCDVIHTLDRPKLVDEWVRLRDAGLSLPRVLVQVNIGREDQKGGVLPEDLQNFLALCRHHNVSIEGLMAVPPAGQDPVPFFQDLAKMARENQLPQLSMGMSGDYQDALKNGSTMIRVGTALFGHRG